MIAVTGGAGFIGTAVVKELTSRGMEAKVIDKSKGDDVAWGVYDLSDCESVIHLAGVLGTAELFDDPFIAVDVNICGTLHVLKDCERYGLKYVGIQMPQVWMNPYQATKGCAKDLASAWNLHKGVPVSHVRAFNVFGEGQKVHGVQKILPTFSSRAWENLPIPIWGDGTQTVDLVHVDDVARMLVDALAFGDDQVFDAGTGTSFSVNEVADMVLTHTASVAGVTYLDMRPGEHEAKVIADGEGWETLGWKPEFDEEKLKETIQWYRTPRP